MSWVQPYSPIHSISSPYRVILTQSFQLHMGSFASIGGVNGVSHGARLDQERMKFEKCHYSLDLADFHLSWSFWWTWGLWPKLVRRCSRTFWKWLQLSEECERKEWDGMLDWQLDIYLSLSIIIHHYTNSPHKLINQQPLHYSSHILHTLPTSRDRASNMEWNGGGLGWLSQGRGMGEGGVLLSILETMGMCLIHSVEMMRWRWSWFFTSLISISYPSTTLPQHPCQLPYSNSMIWAISSLNRNPYYMDSSITNSL